MLLLCGGALIVGMSASFAIPFVPFAAALLLAIGIGAGWAGFHAAGLGQLILTALTLLVSAQIGYGLGLVATAAVDGSRSSARRSGAAAKRVSPVSDLHIGEKP